MLYTAASTSEDSQFSEIPPQKRKKFGKKLKRKGQPHKNKNHDTECWYTGHSLGGALATLCAFDIAAAIRDSAGSSAPSGLSAEQGNGFDSTEQRRPRTQVCCYTFGAPRTGNRAFMKEYNALVPDSWALINDQVSML